MTWTSRLPCWCLGALLAIRLATVVWGAGRGLELGDEGFLLLNLGHPEGAPPLFGFYALIAWLDPSPQVGVVGVRLLRIATEALATLALVAGAAVWARRRLLPAGAPGFVPLLVLAALGSFVSTASRSFGYNDLTNLCIFSATGCMLAVAGSSPGARIPGRALAFFAGLLIGLQLLVKFPAAGLLLVVFAAAIAFAGTAGARERIVRSGALLAGAVVMPLAFVWVIGGPAALVERLELAGAINRLAGYGIGEILTRYLLLDLHAWAQLGLWLGATAGIAGVAMAALPSGSDPGPDPGSDPGPDPGRDPRDRAMALAIGVSAIALAVTAIRWHPFWVDASLIHLFASLLGLTVVLGLASLRARRRCGEPIAPLLWLGWLAALPFVAIVGSNVPLTMRLPTHVAPLVLCVVLLALDLASRGGRRTAGAAVAVLAVTTSWVFVVHQVQSPYGIPAPLYRQSETLEGLPSVRVDPESRAFLEGVHERLSQAGYRRGDPLVALDYMPGLVWYLGGRSPVFPFYVFDNPGLNCFNLNRATRPLRPFLILGRDMSEAQLSCIDAFDFPDDFRLLARIRNPYAGVYARSFGGPGMEQARLYAPLGAPTRSTTPDASASSTEARLGGRKSP